MQCAVTFGVFHAVARLLCGLATKEDCKQPSSMDNVLLMSVAKAPGHRCDPVVVHQDATSMGNVLLMSVTKAPGHRCDPVVVYQDATFSSSCFPRKFS
jgi:hypothetical protein